MFGLSSSGSFDNLERYLKKSSNTDRIIQKLNDAGKAGVLALSAATPVDSSPTAQSWEYEVVRESNGYAVIWSNTNVADGTPVAILLQYGHGTGTGGYVQGRDYINPALKPIFDRFADEIRKEVS